MKQLLEHPLFAKLWQFIKFGIVGLSNTIISLGVYEVCLYLGMHYLPADALAEKTLDKRRICRTFGECTNGPRHGMISGCFPLDEFYKKMPQAAKLRELKKQLNK